MKIYARNMKTSGIDNSEARIFTEQHHRDGCPKQITDMMSYCLYDSNDVLAVAIFGNPRTRGKQEKYTKELIRLTFKTDVRIVGGASKLFKFIMSENKLYDFFTYQDTTGEVTDLYRHAGMTFVSQAKKKQYLVKNGKTLMSANRKEAFGMAYALQYGPDRILGTTFGQNTGKTNKDLFLEAGYHVEETTGDRVYEWFNPNWTHFVYRTTATDGSPGYYIGVHSIPVPDATVEQCITYDEYYGSGKGKFSNWKQAKGTNGLQKEILGIYPTRCEAFEAEALILGDKYETDPNCKNTANGGRGSSRCVAATPRIISGINDLASVNPALILEWDYEKNGVLTPSLVMARSHIKVWWKCKTCDHEWKASINSRSKKSGGTGCPNCANKKRGQSAKLIKGVNDLASIKPELREEWMAKNKIVFDNAFTSSGRKVWWKCKTCSHEWESLISNRVMGSGCPSCAGKVVIPGVNDLETCFPEITKEWNHKQNKKKPFEYLSGSDKKVWWVCPKDGYEYKARIHDRTGRGNGCPVCAGKVILPGVNDLATKFPDLVSEWHPTKNKLTPDQVPPRSSKNFWWICPNGHEYEASPANRTSDTRGRGHGTGCIYCSGKRILPGFNDLATLHPEALKEWDFDRNEIKPTEVGTGSKKVWWICSNCGHNWECTVHNRVKRKSGCPCCHHKLDA